MSTQPISPEILADLYQQIEIVYHQFKQIKDEAHDIASSEKMPDAQLQLEDVIKSTEDATTIILDTATQISLLMQDPAVPGAISEKASEYVGRIYEACSFQDLSSQRIKKVLNHLNELGLQLQRLSDVAHSPDASQTRADTVASLKNGPQLMKDAPSQDQINSMFMATED